MNFDLTDEQELIRATAREFADREIFPRAKENARNEHFDLELVAMLAEQGYLGAIVPREYGGGWEINGAKMWISLAGHANVALIFAQTDPDLRHRGLACFLVDTSLPGFSAQSIHHKMGLHGSDTASIALDAVFAPDDALLGEVGQGFKIAMSALDSGRYSVAAGCVGICQGCVEESVKYATQRRQFDRPVASFQLVQELIAEMTVETEAARLLVWRAGHLKDQG